METFIGEKQEFDRKPVQVFESGSDVLPRLSGCENPVGMGMYGLGLKIP